MVSDEDAKVEACTEDKLTGFPSKVIDHAEMCKYKDRKNLDYQRIVNVLRGWVDEIKDLNKAAEPKKACSLVAFDCDCYNKIVRAD